MSFWMKSQQKITRVQLDVDANEDFLLLGIVSAEPDYKLSLAINKKLSLSLKHGKPVEVKDDNGTQLHFSRFLDHSSNSGLSYDLISNRSEGAFLMRKLNKIDYLLQVHSPENDFNIDNLITALRKIELITAVFPIEPGDIKDKNLQYLIT